MAFHPAASVDGFRQTFLDGSEVPPAVGNGVRDADGRGAQDGRRHGRHGPVAGTGRSEVRGGEDGDDLIWSGAPCPWEIEEMVQVAGTIEEQGEEGDGEAGRRTRPETQVLTLQWRHSSACNSATVLLQVITWQP